MGPRSRPSLDPHALTASLRLRLAAAILARFDAVEARLDAIEDDQRESRIGKVRELITACVDEPACRLVLVFDDGSISFLPFRSQRSGELRDLVPEGRA